MPFVSLLSFLYYNIFCQKNQPLLYQYNCYYEKFSDGTIKNIQDEIPFDLPNGWSWCRLKCICPYGECDNVECSEIKNDDWILDLEDIEKDSGKILAFAKKSDKNSISTKHKFYQGQLLYSKLRPYLNKVVIAPKAGYCTSEILPLLFWGDIDVHYMQMYLMSNVFLSYTDKISYGVKMPRLGTADGKQALIALPPNNEQKLIAKTFQDILPALETIKTEQCALEDIINLLKSKVLELAIQGKLVPQDENDEPAGVLLERIRAERKAKLGKKYVESYIFKGDDNCYYEKVGKNEPVLLENLPFDIPDSWCWARLENAANINPRNNIDDNLDVSFVEMKSIMDGFNNAFCYEKCKWRDVKSGFTHFKNGDVGFAKITPCFQNRKSVVFHGLENCYGAGTTELHILRAYSDTIFSAYLLYFVKSPYFIEPRKD